MGERLAKSDQHPDLIVTSPAKRALKTARILARKLHYSRRAIVVNPALQACAVRELLQTIRALDESHSRVMLIGHNPELTGLARRFSRHITHMPTCAVASFTFDTDAWANVGLGAPVRVHFDYPKRKRT
jgi:phosphohistidine phosphatase